MKKIFFLAVVFGFFIFFFSETEARYIVIGKLNGGPNGYNYVQETHKPADANGPAQSTLLCKDPGYDECKWTTDPATLQFVNCDEVEWQDLYDYAENQISNGNLSGSYQSNKTYCGEEYYRNVTWTATDIYNSDINIEIYVIE